MPKRLDTSEYAIPVAGHDYLHAEEGSMYIASVDDVENHEDGLIYSVTTNPPDIETMFEYDHEQEICITIFVPFWSEPVFVKCNSHRARKSLLVLFPEADAFYHVDMFSKKNNHKGIYQIPARGLEHARRAIKGITKLRDQNPDSYSNCWNF